MDIPVPFGAVLKRWRCLDAPRWTNGLKRHVCAVVEHSNAAGFVKLALARRRDARHGNMFDGMRREVWWSQVIERLAEDDPDFPFRSPRVIETNVDQEPFRDEVAWVVMEYINGTPIVDWEPEWSNREMSADEVDRYLGLLDQIALSLVALDRIHPHTLVGLGCSRHPLALHSIRYMHLMGDMDISKMVLGNGAFEIKNFWQDSQGKLVVIDNEFAGWYPRYDQLAYLYHRLYCNTKRPDLARELLHTYFEKVMQAGIHWNDFSGEFAPLLKRRVLGGLYHDTMERKFPPWHEKQRLRYDLLWRLLREKYNSLAY